MSYNFLQTQSQPQWQILHCINCVTFNVAVSRTCWKRWSQHWQLQCSKIKTIYWSCKLGFWFQCSSWATIWCMLKLTVADLKEHDTTIVYMRVQYKWSQLHVLTNTFIQQYKFYHCLLNVTVNMQSEKLAYPWAKQVSVWLQTRCPQVCPQCMSYFLKLSCCLQLFINECYLFTETLSWTILS